MPIYHKCAQYSDEYDRLRLGLPTSSKAERIITPSGMPAKGWEKYAHHLIAERLLGYPVATFSSPYMETALTLESSAVEFYEQMNDVKTESIGFVTDNENTVGASPDRLIGEDGLLEIKCPQPQTQVEYLLTGSLGKNYKPQLQSQLMVTGRKWADICAWHPELPPCIMRVERDEEYIACLAALLAEFNNYITQVITKIKQTQKGKSDGLKEIQF